MVSTTNRFIVVGAAIILIACFAVVETPAKRNTKRSGVDAKAYSFAADDEKEGEMLDALVATIDRESVHDRYALDKVRDIPFTVEPSYVVEIFKGLNYQVVPAPDPTEHHPMLFYVKAPYAVMEGSHMATPTLEIVVHPQVVSMTYRFYATTTDQLKFLRFCNRWNFKQRLSSCYLDPTDNYMFLQNDVQLSAAGGGSCLREVGHKLIEEGAAYFKLSVKMFANKLSNEMLKPDEF